MALENTRAGRIYLSVFAGKLTQNVPEGTEGATERKNKNGRIVHELTYDKLTGLLTDISFRVGDYGKEIHFTVEDGIETYLLQQPFSSKVAKSIIMRLPNCDLTKDIDIHTGWDTTKESTFSFIRQDGQTVKSKYTKDEPNGLPPMEQIKVKGEDVWDDTKQLEFLSKMIQDDILPKLKAKPEPKPAPEPIDPEQDGDDLPW